MFISFSSVTLSVCARYEAVEKRALLVPANFQEMAESIQQMDVVLKSELPKLQKEIGEVRRRFLYLINVSSLTQEHMELNNVTFTWPSRVMPILEQNEAIIKQSKKSNQVILRERRTKFEDELLSLSTQVDELNGVGNIEEMAFYAKKVAGLMKQAQVAAETIAAFNREEQLFQWEQTQYPQRTEIMARLEPYQQLYGTVVQFQKNNKKWMDGPVQELEVEAVEAELGIMKRDLLKQLVNTFGEEADPSGKLKVPAGIAHQTIAKIEEFTQNLPIMRVLCNPGLRDRHWLRMSEICGFEIKPGPGRESLRKMLKLGPEQWLKEFAEVSDVASREFAFERAIAKMRTEWSTMEYTCLAYRESKTYIVAAMDEVQQLLDDQIVKTQSMRGSPYIKPFEAEIRNWEACLILTQDIIDEWLKVQASWLYLEPIFSSQDILNQMPEEGKKFKTVDSGWRALMEVKRESQGVFVRVISLIGNSRTTDCSPRPPRSDRDSYSSDARELVQLQRTLRADSQGTQPVSGGEAVCICRDRLAYVWTIVTPRTNNFHQHLFSALLLSFKR